MNKTVVTLIEFKRVRCVERNTNLSWYLGFISTTENVLLPCTKLWGGGAEIQYISSKTNMCLGMEIYALKT
jgi:hypothetical protein